MNRAIAILSLDNSDTYDVIYHNVSMIMANVLASDVYVFTIGEAASFNMAHERCKSANIQLPADCNTMPKARNWINKFFKSQQFNGFLYVLESNVKLESNAIQFFDKIENMMRVLDYPVWFNTIADPCNYVYKKYSPRVSIDVDQLEYAKLGFSKLLYTSHANTAMIAYDFSRVTDDQLVFNEQFEIAMYYIIEYLARRKNSKADGSLFFMNQYLTIPEEKDVFTVVKTECKKKDEITPQQMQEEDKTFKSMNINYAPDNSIDKILEMTYEKLKSKVIV